MIWVYALIAAVLCAPLGLFAAGGIASVCIGWYSISSREGGAGYFMVFLGLLGGVAGLVIGGAAAAIVGSSMQPGFLVQTGCAIGAVGLTACVAFVLARCFAPIPPTFLGTPLEIELEIRLGEGVGVPKPETSSVILEAISLPQGKRHGEEPGILDLAAVRIESGRFIVPVRLPIFTSRGKRILTTTFDGVRESFILPVGAFPWPKARWSSWVPRRNPPGFTRAYRFRVRKASSANG